MIEISDSQIKRVNEILSGLSLLAKHEVYKKAINAGIRAARTAASQGIRKTYAIFAADLSANSRITLKAASGYNMAAYIHYSGHAIQLYRFNVTPKMAPSRSIVSAGVLRSSGRTPFPDAFIQRVKGDVGMFERETEDKYPIHHILAVSVAQMAERAEVEEAAERAAQEKVNTTLEQEISRILNKY